MTELVCDMFVSLDGYAKGEGSSAFFGYDGPDLQAWIAAESARDEQVLMGRKTYETLRRYGGKTDDGMTSMRKLVATREGIDTSDWANSAVLAGEARETVADLKADGHGRIRTFGSLSLVRDLMSVGLVDRLRLMVFPLVLGARGREPMFERAPESDMQLLCSSVLDARVVLLEYKPLARV